MRLDLPFGGIIAGPRGAVLASLMRTGTPMTGRQVHGLFKEDHSLWTIQESLKDLAQLGLIHTQTIGRAGVHTVNEDHAAMPHLRSLLDPIAVVAEAVRSCLSGDVTSVILFGSVARGDARADSDIDLAVIASPRWAGRTDLEDSIRARTGNACDVLVFSNQELWRLEKSGEPVVADILNDGVALVGSMPTRKRVVD